MQKDVIFTREKITNGKVILLFKEGKDVTVMIKLINLWPSIKHKNKINIKVILHCHYKKNLKMVWLPNKLRLLQQKNS